MLPGFRFLFAAIVLSTSILIFGLGAAALLRAAHEEFASIPSRRPPPETPFAQPDDAAPTLALLRAEPSAADEKTADLSTTDNVADQPAVVAAPEEPEMPAGDPDKIAALSDVATPAENPPPSEAPTPEASTPEISASADAPPSGVEAKVAAIAETTPAAPEQAGASTDGSTKIAETRIATLGGPPVKIETRPPSRIAPAVAKKQAKHVITRRRIVRRAPAPLQASQKPADPFGQPLGR